MKVLMVEPHKNAYESDIGNDLKSMQEAVGGSIEAAYFFEAVSYTHLTLPTN